MDKTFTTQWEINDFHVSAFRHIDSSTSATTWRLFVSHTSKIYNAPTCAMLGVPERSDMVSYCNGNKSKSSQWYFKMTFQDEITRWHKSILDVCTRWTTTYWAAENTIDSYHASVNALYMTQWITWEARNIWADTLDRLCAKMTTIRVETLRAFQSCWTRILHLS